LEPTKYVLKGRKERKVKCESGKVDMYLSESSIREWKGWDVFEGKFNE